MTGGCRAVARATVTFAKLLFQLIHFLFVYLRYRPVLLVGFRIM